MITGFTPFTPALPFVDLQQQRQRLGSAIDSAIARVLQHGGFVLGPEVAELESQLAKRVESAHCITCGSGTEALVMTLMAYGIGSVGGGSSLDAIFCPAFTFVATAEAAALVAATPVFVDVEPEQFNIDTVKLQQSIEAAIAIGLRPRLIMPVDLFGHPADYQAILPIAEQYGMKVLCDAAQSFGSHMQFLPKNQQYSIGNIGNATATSFFPAKPLGCYGEGGAIFTNDDELAKALKSIRAHGMGSDRYEHIRIGMNGRLETIQAAILLQKLTIFDDEIIQRQAVADRYSSLLLTHGAMELGVKLPQVRAGVQSAWAQYTVILPETVNRAAIIAFMKDLGIPAMVYYPIPLNQQPAYRHYPCPLGATQSQNLSTRVLSLPMHPYLTEELQSRITVAFIQAIVSQQ